MKIIFLLTFLSLIGIRTFSQENSWKKLYENNGIEFSSIKSECHDNQNGIHEEYFLVQISNNTNAPILLKWHFHFYNNDNCINCKEDVSDIKTYSIRIAAGESVKGTCDNTDQKGLKVFSRFLTYKTTNPVTGFTVENVEVIFE